MPGKSRFKLDFHVKCEYFRKETSLEIKCKGLCGSHTVNVFQNGQDKADFKDDFCNGNNKACPLWIALNIDED